MQVEYFGYEPIKTSISVAYSGVPSGIPMDDLQKQFVEDVTAEYLAEQTVGLTNVAIVGTKITNQRGPGFKQNRLRSLQEGGSGGKWIELSMDVLGILDGPYTGKSNFFDMVDVAFQADDMSYIEDLKMGRHRPGSQVQGARGDYFVDINQILAKHPDDVDSSTPNNNPGSGSANGVTDSDSDDGSSTILGLNPAVFSIICLGLIVIGILYVWYIWCWKSKGDADEAEETQVFVDSKGKQLKPETVKKILTEQGGHIIDLSSQRGKSMGQLSDVETSESSNGSRGKSGRKKPQTKTGTRKTKSSNAARASSRNVRSSADGEQLQRGQSSKQWRDGTKASGSKSTKNSTRLEERSSHHRSSRNIQPPSAASRIAEQRSSKSLSNQAASPARSSRGLSSNAAATTSPSSAITRNSERSTRSMRSSSHTTSITSSPKDVTRSSLRSSQGSSSRGSSSAALPPRSPSSASEHTRSMRSSVHSRRQQASTHTRSSEHSSRSMRASNKTASS